VKKRVLQLINSFHQGGSERQAVQLTRLLREDGEFEVFLACLNDEGILRPEVEKLGLTDIPEFRLSSFFNFGFFRQAGKFAKLLRQKRIDIVQTHDFYTNVFGMAAATLAGVKLRIAAKRETGSMRSRGQQIVEKLAFGRAHRIVANAGAVRDYLIKEGISAGKIEVIHNGLDLERLRPEETERARICRALDLPGGNEIRFIALVANLRHPVKNQPMFLRAAGKVLEKHSDSHFVLAGEGQMREKLEEMAGDLKISDRTHFIGRCTQVPELLALSFACTLTSFNEGFSNSILEYMAAGKPVVATRVGGAAEAIVDGETGFLVESDDCQALADRLIRLLDNEEKAAAMGKKGRQTVEGKFSLAAQLEKTKALYRTK
jgi:glycosyltransferase involved in cell wall biosynthesis